MKRQHVATAVITGGLGALLAYLSGRPVAVIALTAALAALTNVAIVLLGQLRRTLKARRRPSNDLPKREEPLLDYQLRPPDRPDAEGSERLWDDFDRPRMPYPGHYRPEDDRAAQLPGQVQHGAGAMRYFARTMHDHRRGLKHCPACSSQAR